MFSSFLSFSRTIVRKVRLYWNGGKPQLSYSQAGEDLIIRFIFNALNIKKPTYCDIGAYHPTYLSNTYNFYRNGSSGICIEPDPDLYHQYKRIRKRDKCLNIGVGVDNKEFADFYVLSTKTLNTFSKTEAEKCVSYGQKIEKIVPIRLVNVNEILSSHFQDKTPNFVSLDIEGLDFEVIKTFNFSKFRPEVFCIETLTYTENKTEKKIVEIIEYMETQDYFVYADTYINTIFVDASAWAGR